MSVKIIYHLRSFVEFVLLSAKCYFEDGNIKRPSMTNQAGAILVSVNVLVAEDEENISTIT